MAYEYACGVISTAVASGKVVPPNKCENCGIETRLHGHHEDYSKPLEVKWLCPKCHKGKHPKVKKGKQETMDYLLRGIDKEIWEQVKIKAITKGLSIKTLILSLLVKWLKEK